MPSLHLPAPFNPSSSGDVIEDFTIATSTSMSTTEINALKELLGINATPAKPDWYCYEKPSSEREELKSMICFTNADSDDKFKKIEFGAVEKVPKRYFSQYVTNIQLYANDVSFTPVISLRKKEDTNDKKIRHFQVEVLSSHDLVVEVVKGGIPGPSGKSFYNQVDNVFDGDTAVHKNTIMEELNNGVGLVWNEFVKGNIKHTFSFEYDFLPSTILTVCSRAIDTDVDYSSYNLRWIEEW